MHPASAFVTDYAQLINETLLSKIPVSLLAGAERLNDAVYYATFPGGKRMRPTLVLLACEACGGKVERALPAAAAIEFLHAASLIIDDLPAMDDAAIRRGVATVHRMFGEDTAILAALALLNESYALLADYPGLLRIATREIGARGMIGGQSADISGGAQRSRMEKTTSLLRLAMAAGSSAANADSRDAGVLISFGDSLGELYQICDDIIDTVATQASAGKTVGQDRRHQRWNHMSAAGYELSCERVLDLAEDAAARLRAHFGRGPCIDRLEGIARAIVDRGLNGQL